jgi:hypothetical protein
MRVLVLHVRTNTERVVDMENASLPVAERVSLVRKGWTLVVFMPAFQSYDRFVVYHLPLCPVLRPVRKACQLS